MPRTTIAAVLAMLLLLAPAASARPIDSGYPAYPTPEVAAKPKVMSERITDHPAPKVDALSALVREQESTAGSGNQGNSTDAVTLALAQERAYSKYAPPASVKLAPAPVADSDDGPSWPLVGAGFFGVALLFGAAVLLVSRPRRARVAA